MVNKAEILLNNLKVVKLYSAFDNMVGRESGCCSNGMVCPKPGASPALLSPTLTHIFNKRAAACRGSMT